MLSLRKLQLHGMLQLEDKRRQDDTSMEDAQRKKKQQRAEGGPSSDTAIQTEGEYQFEETGDTSNESSDPSQASTSKDTSTQKKPVKKGPGYLLAREVERIIEAEEIAEKFWQQEARGFTNGDLFGSLRMDLQNKILERAKRKRIYKEGPHALTAKVQSS